jgi:hypothetical protein
LVGAERRKAGIEVALATATWRDSRRGELPLDIITNAVVREWVSAPLSPGLAAATTRKAVFALRQSRVAAIADERIRFNPANAVLPAERQKPPSYLSHREVGRLVDEMPRNTAPSSSSARTPAFAGTSSGLRTRDIDALRSRSV